MAFTPQDFRFQGQVPMASIIQAFQQKAQMEQQDRMAREQQKRQKHQDMLKTIGMASDLVRQTVARSKEKQTEDARRAFAELLMGAGDPMAMGAGGMANVPHLGGDVPIAQMGTRGQMPQYQAEMKAAAMGAYPEEASKQAMKGLFAPADSPSQQRLFMRNVNLDEEPTTVLDDGRGGLFFTDKTPVPSDAKITPYSPMYSPVQLTEKDRENTVLQRQAQSVYEGKTRPSDHAATRTPRAQKIAALASEIAAEKGDTLDLSLVDERKGIRREFTTGRRSQEGKALDTAIHHVDKLLDASEAMQKAGVRKYNTVKQWTEREAKGNPELVKTSVLAMATTKEVLRVLQGVGVVTQQEADELRSNIDVNAAPEEFQGAVDALLILAGGRLITLRSDWEHKMGKLEPPFPIMNERSKKILERRGYDPETMEPIGTSAFAEQEANEFLQGLFGGGR